MTPAPREVPLTDAFTLSNSLLYLPTTYRASMMAQMETLRRAKSYRPRWYIVPDDQQQTIPAYSQLEQQVSSLEGSYLWGLIFSVLTTGDTGVVSVAQAPSFIHLQITDACTETQLFADYVYGSNALPSTGPSYRNPLLPTPLLLGRPANLDVEIYNHASVSITCQLMMLIMEPMMSPDQMEMALSQQGML